MNEESTIIPQMDIFPKDHKNTHPDGTPKGRPVCKASNTMNQRVSDLCSDVLGAVYNSEEGHEVQSAEHLLSRIEELNAKIRKKEINSERMMVGSLDVEALYPSIDVRQAGEICRDRILNSELKQEGIDYRWALIYLALTATPVERVDLGLQGVIPKKISKFGRKPTVRTADADEKRERWSYPVDPEKLSLIQKKKIQAGVVQQMIKLVFSTHFYEWEGVFYQQVTGGPIGLRATGYVARVVMDFWAQKIGEMEDMCQTLWTLNPVMFENVQIHLLCKYVDDCFMAVDTFRLGIRWNSQQKAMVWSLESEEEDRSSGEDPEVITMREIAKMATEVMKCLKFTFDTPKLNKSLTMPVLDSQIWVGNEQRETGIPVGLLRDTDLIQVKTGELQKVVLFMFYQKPMVNRTSNLARSAAPEGQKVSTCTQEVLRRLKTTSRDLLPNS